MDHNPHDNMTPEQHDPYGQPPTPVDETMGGTGDSSASTTFVGNYPSQQRPQTSQSADSPMSSGGHFSPQPDENRYPSPNMAYQQQPMHSSRPSSGHANNGANGHGQYGYQEQNQRQAQQEAAKATASNIVIKVGMVGDAQIGKTSLMVKYVEGSWDEDYIQTLGKFMGTWTMVRCSLIRQVSTSWKRRSLYETPKSPSRSGI